MRILHVVTRYQRGGSERDIAHLVRWQLARGHQVHIAVGRDSILSELPPSINSHVVQALVRRVSPIRDVRAWWSIRRLVSDLGIDIVHTHQSKAGIIGRLAAHGRARTIIHTLSGASFGPQFSRPMSAMFKVAERYCAKFTDRIVSVGHELVSIYLAAGIASRSKYTVVRSPIEIEGFLRARGEDVESRKATRQRFGIGSGPPLALMVANFEPGKRIGLVIRSLATDIRAGTLTLAVAGDGNLRPELEKEIAELDIEHGVRLLGYVKAIPDLMGAADVLVCAGAAEGVPQVVIQAHAAGLPIVATDTIGLRELDGGSMTIVDRDGDGLVSGVRSALGRPRRLVAPAALDEWAPAAVDMQIEQLYASIEGLVT
jgi:glycosyltransferase involved in cell wall biosynthesis